MLDYNNDIKQCYLCKHNFKPNDCEPKCNMMCENKNEFEPITNRECINRMTDEELSVFLCNLTSRLHRYSGDCETCIASEFCSENNIGFNKWLKIEIDKW